jgi:hypothetical protein
MNLPRNFFDRAPWLQLQTLEGQDLHVPLGAIALIHDAEEGSRIWIDHGSGQTCCEQFTVRESAAEVQSKMTETAGDYVAAMEHEAERRREIFRGAAGGLDRIG